METINKRKYILDIAEELICHYGSKDTTVRLIAQKANINAAMLNYYFESKENLLVMLFERRIEQFKDAEKLLDMRNKTASEKLSGYIHFFIDLIVDHHSFCKLMMKEKLSNENEKIVNLIDSYCKWNQEKLKRDSNCIKIDFDDFIMMLTGTLVAAILRIDRMSDISNQMKKIKIRKDLDKIHQGLMIYK